MMVRVTAKVRTKESCDAFKDGADDTWLPAAEVRLRRKEEEETDSYSSSHLWSCMLLYSPP